MTKEQYYGPSNETTYWNYTYDERGNKITEEFTRTGSSPWSTITTFTWNYGAESTGVSSESGSSEGDSTSNMWLVLLLIVLILATAYLVYNNTKNDTVRTLTDFDTDKVIKEMLEEE